jgi:hypothetical protein
VVAADVAGGSPDELSDSMDTRVAKPADALDLPDLKIPREQLYPLVDPRNWLQEKDF